MLGDTVRACPELKQNKSKTTRKNPQFSIIEGFSNELRLTVCEKNLMKLARDTFMQMQPMCVCVFYVCMCVVKRT